MFFLNIKCIGNVWFVARRRFSRRFVRIFNECNPRWGCIADESEPGVGL
jgi:hypothetical protein